MPFDPKFDPNNPKHRRKVNKIIKEDIKRREGKSDTCAVLALAVLGTVSGLGAFVGQAGI